MQPSSSGAPSTYLGTFELAANGVLRFTAPGGASGVNTPPTLAPIGPRTINEGETLRFVATASDPDLPSPILVFGLDSAALPEGAAIDPHSGSFVWTPGEIHGGQVFPMTVRVTDEPGGGADSETILVTVNEVNVPPVLNPVGRRSAVEGEVLTFRVTGSDADLPPQALAYSLDPDSLAMGARIAAESGEFFWTPDESRGGGVFRMTVVLSDRVAGGTAAETFDIAVSESNQLPVLTPVGPLSVYRGDTLRFTFSATDLDTPVQELTFDLDDASKALGARIDPDTGVFVWVPSETHGGEIFPMTVLVSDGTESGKASETFRVTVEEINHPPVLAAIGNRTVEEGGLLTFTAVASDADLPPNPLVFGLDAASAALGASIHPSNGVFRWTPDESRGGQSVSITVRVTDPAANSEDSETFVVRVLEVNQTPSLTPSSDQVVQAGATLALKFQATDPDLPAQSLIYSLDGDSRALGASVRASSGVFSWTPGEAHGGQSFAMTIRVSDGGPSSFDSETIRVAVDEVNESPVLAPFGNKSVREGETLSFALSATDPDLPAQRLVFGLDSAGLGLGATLDPTCGGFSWTPGESEGGRSFTLIATVRDGAGGTSERSFQVAVVEVNSRPVLEPIGNRSVAAGSTLAFSVRATDPDLPPDAVFYELDGESRALGASIGFSDGRFTWAPPSSLVGRRFTMTVTAFAGLATSNDDETFEVTVTEPAGAAERPSIRSFSLVGGRIEIVWAGGKPPFTIQVSPHVDATI